MHRMAGGLLALLVTVAVAATTGWAEEKPTAVDVELNKFEAQPNGCRAYLVVRNRTQAKFSSLKLDLVMFDPDGIVAKRLAVEAAPLPKDKTSLKVFDIAGVGCERIGRLLLNDVLACEREPAGDGDCLSMVAVSSRGATEFMR